MGLGYHNFCLFDEKKTKKNWVLGSYGKVQTGLVRVMENLESQPGLSRPGKSWNFSVGHGKSWKMILLKKCKIIREVNGKKTYPKKKDDFQANGQSNLGHGKLGQVMKSHGIS